MEKQEQNHLEIILRNIKSIRERKGYSLEYMANNLDISTVAYEKIEKKKTRLTVERLLRIEKILEVALHEILGVDSENNFKQVNNDNSSGYLIRESSGYLIREQKVENLYQDNQSLREQLITSYKSQIENLTEDKKRLSKQIENFMKAESGT